MVILLSTRGTAGSDIWFMCLADKPMVRGYHLRDYDWTPLSQNPAQKCNDAVSASALGGKNTPSLREWMSLGVCLFSVADWCDGWTSDTHPMQCRGAKSFVDDLGLSRGVVLSRAAASLRSIETKPFDWKICPLWKDTPSRRVRCEAFILGCQAYFFQKYPTPYTVWIWSSWLV